MSKDSEVERKKRVYRKEDELADQKGDERAYQKLEQLGKDRAAWRADPAPLDEIVSAIVRALEPYQTHIRKRLETSPNLEQHQVPPALAIHEARLRDDGLPGYRELPTDPPRGASERQLLAAVHRDTSGPWCWAGISDEAIQDGLNEAVHRRLVQRFAHEGREHFRLSESLAKDDVEPGDVDELVTLNQVAPLTGLTKRTLERHLSEGKLPQPDIRGGGGRASKWRWKNLRIDLAKVAKRTLPERYPGSRII